MQVKSLFRERNFVEFKNQKKSRNSLQKERKVCYKTIEVKQEMDLQRQVMYRQSRQYYRT